MKKSIYLFIAIVFSLSASCRRENTSRHSSSDNKIELKYARLLKLYKQGESGAVRADIINPWDTTKILRSYLLVHRDSLIPESSGDVTVIRTPLSKSVVYSGVHASLIAELGNLNSISGLCDVNYISDKKITAAIESGKIENCGSNTSPNMERIMNLRPDAVLLSPYENSGSNEKFDLIKATVVECADYMESSPMARAEWMKFYGMLYGSAERADSLFNIIDKEYSNLKTIVANAKTHPVVVFDRIYGGIWYVPAHASTTATFLKDAGAENPFDYNNNSGAAALSPEEVLAKAANADFWLIRFTNEDISYSILASDNPIYKRFKPFSTHKIYGADTTKSGLFDDAAFHPHWILADMIALLHPELEVPDYGRKYYKPINN